MLSGRGLGFFLLALFLLRSGQGGQALAHDVKQSMSVVDEGAFEGPAGSDEGPSDEASCSPCRGQCFFLLALFWLLQAYDEDPGRSSGSSIGDCLAVVVAAVAAANTAAVAGEVGA